MSAVPVRRGPGASPPVEARGETRVVLSLLVGTAALGAVFGLAAALPDLGWWDAWTLAYFTGLRACRAGDGVRTFTNAAPYLAALLAGTSVATAVVKGRRAEGVGVLVLLALALLLVQALKFLFERNRPGLPPWVDAADQSFPSGHVANAAICVAAALRLGPPFGGPTLRRIATPLALTFVLAVGWSRLWLERHWLTDVAAGLLLGLAFWGLAARPTARATVVGAALVALVALPEVLVPRASRMRIGLHSPASVELGDLRGQADVAAERLAADEGRITFLPNWSPAGPPFVRVTGPEAHLTLADAPRRRGVLRVVARPLRGVRRRGCARLEVSVDGVRVAAPALHVDWRTYPFALPALAPGPHRVALRVLTGEQPPAPHDPVLGIALVAFGR